KVLSDQTRLGFGALQQALDQFELVSRIWFPGHRPALSMPQLPGATPNALRGGGLMLIHKLVQRHRSKAPEPKDDCARQKFLPCEVRPDAKRKPALCMRGRDLSRSQRTLQTRYLSIFSPASCLALSQVAIRPRPDHVSFVFGSRYFAFTDRFFLPFNRAAPLRTPLGRPRFLGTVYPSAASWLSNSARLAERPCSCCC